MKTEPEHSWLDFATALMMAFVGGLMFVLPIVTWPNTKVFAVLYSPGLLLGPLLVYGGVVSAWEEFRVLLRRG